MEDMECILQDVYVCVWDKGALYPGSGHNFFEIRPLKFPPIKINSTDEGLPYRFIILIKKWLLITIN